MDKGKSFITLKELSVICGTTENNEPLPEKLCGFIYKNTLGLQDSTTTLEFANHGFIAAGSTLIKKNGYICECGATFFNKMFALDHYELHKTEKRNGVASTVEDYVNQENESNVVNEINDREKELHESSQLKRKIDRNSLIIECILMEYGVNHDDLYISLCLKRLYNGSRDKKQLHDKLRIRWYKARQRQQNNLENPYQRYIDDDIKREAKTLHEKVSEERIIRSEDSPGVRSRHRKLFEAIVMTYGLKFMSYEFTCALALYWGTARTTIQRFVKEIKKREELGKENPCKNLIDSKIRNEAVRIYEEVSAKLRNDERNEVQNPNHDQENSKVCKWSYLTRIKRSIMEAVFESEGLDPPDESVRKYAHLLKLSGVTIFKWRREIFNRQFRNEVNPHAQFITADIRKRAAVLIQDVKIGATASVAMNGLKKVFHSRKLQMSNYPKWVLLMEAVYHMYGTNQNIYYKRAAADILSVSRKKLHAHWRRVMERAANKEENICEKGFTKQEEIYEEAMNLHRDVTNTLGKIKAKNEFASTKVTDYQRANKIMTWLTHKYGLIDNHWYRESCGAFLNVTAGDIQSFCTNASKDFGSIDKIRTNRKVMRAASKLHTDVMECMANAYKKTDSTYLSQCNLKLRLNCT